jgi:SAM-dependent methyltransferase
MEKKLTTIEYWDQINNNKGFTPADKDNPIRIFIEKHVTPKKDGKVFEVGCFPGSYLSVFSNLGYELNGIDYSLLTESNLNNWLVEKKYKVGQIKSGNFFDVQPGEHYFDVVCSFGFIEHFNDYLSVIEKHGNFVKSGGKLIITTPNFKGKIQKKFHTFFDNENLIKHNLDSMDPFQWRVHMEKKGFETEFCGWFGNLVLWVERQKRPINKKIILKILFFILRIIKKIQIPNNKSYSPYCGLVLIKK